MADSDSDVPDLVASSDDENSDGASTQLTAVQHADRWLKKKGEFLERQELWNRVFCLGPFLFGVNNIIAAAWIKALSNSKLMLREDRQFQIDILDWQEWDRVDLIDLAIKEVHKNLRNKETLSTVIDLVKRLEACKTGLVIDVDLAIQEAEKVTQITNIWRVILSHELSKGKEKAAKFAVLYIVKIYQEHVVKHCETRDFIDFTKSKVEQQKTKALKFKEKGNELFKQKDYIKSEEYYTKAAKLDPFCHVYYGNRAQSYHHLGKYMEALADGRRAITIKPDFPKGHFRYAKAFHELGRLDTAIRVIREGLALCSSAVPSDVKNVNQLKEHLQQFQNEKKEYKKLLNPIPKDLNDRLSTVITDDGEKDITDKFDIRVPPLKKLTGELAIFDDQDRDSSGDRSRKEQEKKKAKKKKEEEMRKKKQSEEEKRKKEEQAELELEKSEKKRLEEEKKEFESYLKQGWEAVNIDMQKNAMLNYRKALDMVTSEEKKMLYGIDDLDVVTLKYAFGISAIKTGIYKNINDGVEKFQDILDNHQDVRFPLAYFGLGKAYITLFRFNDALEPLESGKSIAKNISYVQVTWPGTNHKIPENDSRELLSQIKDLIQVCKVPPSPDAVCRHHTDDTDSRTGIYVNDPGFKGSVKIICQMNCVIPFHMTCWKFYKTGLHKVGDKDVLDTICPTPDCQGFVVKMEVTRHDSITKEYVSTKYTAIKEANKGKKPAVKQKSSSETKMVKKQEKKEIRKQKKKQKYEETVDTVDENEDNGVVITDGASASAFIEEIHETQPLPNLKDSTVLKKDDSDFTQVTSKGKRNRKKKEKKQLLNVEVNFSDRREEMLLNENSVVSDDESNKSKSHTPFSVPSELQSQITNFEKNYQGPSKPLFQPDEVTENLFSYFSDILQASGPLAVDDVKVQQELEVFPPEALDKIKQVGGLCDFLKQSLKFAVIDDVISLLSDAKRAREIALLRRSEREKNSAPVMVPVNAWTTVGKSTNNVDSLKESTLNTPSSVGAPSQMTSGRPNVQSQTPGLASSSSSNSLVSQGSDSANLLQNTKPLTNGLNDHGRVKETKKHSSIDNLDSIDDFPTLPSSSVGRKKVVETINDLDTVSDPESDSEIVTYTKPAPIKPPFDDKLDTNLSRTSSHSDISERSSRSDFSSDMKPKPLRPLGVEKIGLGKKMGVPGMNWDKLESDFDSSWNKVKKEEFEPLSESPAAAGFGSVGLEIKQATEDFVRKSDEKFVSELAESVVEKLYQGKTVSDTERQNTLNKVSSDIWKDFEKSANAGQLRGAGLWADTPAGQDYSNNLGKFATDFMKKHYEKTGENSYSPTSNLTSPFPPIVSSTDSGLGSISSSWSVKPGTGTMQAGFSSPFSASSTGYNLFSGPTWGIDAFNSNNFPSPLGQQAIRPPNLATGFYQRNPAALNSSPGTFPPPNFTPPAFPNLRMPPPFPNSFHSPKTESKDVEVQTETKTNSVSVMTEPYEPYKTEYMKLKEDMKEVLKHMENSKSAYEILVLDLNKKDQKIQELEASLVNKESVHDFDKKNWLNEKKAYSDKLRDLQQQVETKDKTTKDLREKMQNQEKKVNDLATMAGDQRTKDLGEIKKLLEKTEKCHKESELQARRAITAEVEVLKMRLNTTKGYLERSQMEATYHSQHLSAQVSKLKDDSKSIPLALQQTLDYWKAVLQKSEENLNKLKTETETQINEVKNGKKLSELTPVNVGNPPQMPETVKAFMMGAAGQMMMQRSQQGRPPVSGVGAAGHSPLSAPAVARSPLPASPGPQGLASGTHTQGPPQGPPKPLTPINAGKGFGPPRPLSMLRSPAVSGGNKPPPLRPLGVKQPMTSFEKLMYKLNTMFPNHTRQEFDTLIQQLRQEKGGSLSGMTMEDIVSKIGEKIGKNKQAQNHIPTQKPLGPPPGINKSWAFTASSISNDATSAGAGAQRIEMFQEEEDPCVICHEEMTSQPSVTLECNHTFHDECIRKWFQEQSTCPNCRVHTLLSDEFPSLG